MNSKTSDSKTPDPHRLFLNRSEKIDLKISDKFVALSDLSICYPCKNIKKLYKDLK